jgi:hypothetical protein
MVDERDQVLMQRKGRRDEKQIGGSPRGGRFRLTWLRKNDVPKDLEHFWMGHEDEEIGDRYSKLKDDVAFIEQIRCVGTVSFGRDIVQLAEREVSLKLFSL